MRRFSFRLQRLLEIRRYTERERELELAAASGLCAELRGRMADRRARMAAELRRRASGRGVVDMSILRWSEIYRTRLAGEHGEAEAELAQRERERQEAQKRYLEASRDRKVLDRLRERRERDYYRGQRREEFKEMDDISQAVRARGREA